MKCRRLVTVGLTLACAFVCLGASYTWDGGGVDDDWTTAGNWDDDLSYPSGSTDDATFPYDASGWSVDLSSDIGQIDDLVIEGDVDFTGSGTEELSVTKVTLDASSNAITVTVTDMTITTVAP